LPINADKQERRFSKLAAAQRGTPEDAMVEAQFAYGGGVLNPVIEHVGDLTHRMSERNTAESRGYDYVKNKVDKALRNLENDYGFTREFNENIKNNAVSYGVPETQLRSKITTALEKYAAAHRELPVFNEVQRIARDAAVALGEQRWDTARQKLHQLQDYIDEGKESWIKRANVIDTSERGSLPIEKHDIERAKKTIKAIGSQGLSLRERVKREGKSAKELMEVIDTMDHDAANMAGEQLVKVLDSNLHKLKDDQMLDVIGAIQDNRPAKSPLAQENIDVLREIFSDFADLIEIADPKVQLRSGETREFYRMGKEYFPHFLPSVEQLKGGKTHDRVVRNMVANEGYTVEKAQKFVNSYVAFMEKGGHTNELIAALQKKNPKLTEDEALARLLKWKAKGIKHQGSIEHAREVDLPIYDPDVKWVVPKYISEVSQRLVHIMTVGQKDQVVKRYISQIRKEGGDYEFVRGAVDKMLKYVAETDSKKERAARFFTATHGLLLSPISTMKNAFQGEFGSLLGSDLPSTLYGFRKSWTKEGRRLAVESGAALDSVIQESMKHAGASNAVLSTYLKAIGYSKIERRNRTVAANAGYYYAQRLIEQGRGSGKKADHATRRLSELIGKENAYRAVSEGELTPRDLMRAAKSLSDMTQFRSRPQDFPEFASSPYGRMIFQFKSYGYGQARLIYNEFVGEAKAGNFGRAARTFAILTTVYPAGGEVMRNISNIITGKQDDSKGLERYFGDMFMSGALGIFSDAAQSGEVGKGTEMIAGPTLSTAGEAVSITAQGGKGLGRALVRRIPGVGPLIRHRIYPTEKKKKDRFGIPSVRIPSVRRYQAR
jgi:hypothetical protein